MAMMYHVPAAVESVLFNVPAQIELLPIYEEIEVPVKTRSASEMKCAAMMLEKLRRREDVVPDDFEDLIPMPCDSGRAIDAVVERLMEVL